MLDETIKCTSGNNEQSSKDVQHKYSGRTALSTAAVHIILNLAYRIKRTRRIDIAKVV